MNPSILKEMSIEELKLLIKSIESDISELENTSHTDDPNYNQKLQELRAQSLLVNNILNSK